MNEVRIKDILSAIDDRYEGEYMDTISHKLNDAGYDCEYDDCECDDCEYDF
jgi:hypothetical protein